jgi:hypothetical protein
MGSILVPKIDVSKPVDAKDDCVQAVSRRFDAQTLIIACVVR